MPISQDFLIRQKQLGPTKACGHALGRAHTRRCVCPNHLPGALKTNVGMDLRKITSDCVRWLNESKRIDCLTLDSQLLLHAVLNFGNFAHNRIDFCGKTL